MGPVAERTPAGTSRDVSVQLPVTQLRAGDLRIDHADDTLTIAITLRWEGPLGESGSRPEQRLHIAVGDLDRLGGDRRLLLAAHTPPHATALVPLLAVIAASNGADLTIDAPVCPSALAGARRAIAAGQLTHGWPPITLGATAGATGVPRGGGDALVFSLGLDAIATLLHLHRSARPPTHLLAVDGLDTPATTRHVGDHHAACARWRAEAMAANAARLPLIRIASNARSFANDVADLPALREATASASALALAGVAGSVSIPLPPAPSPVDDHASGALWSSEAVAISTAVTHRTATERAALVLADPWATEWLQVCASPRSGSNCGHCRQCQLTLAHLWLAGGAPDSVGRFGHPADPAAVRALSPGPPVDQTGLRALVDELLALANGTGQFRSTASPDERLLAAALADAWTVHLGASGVAVPSEPLSA